MSSARVGDIYNYRRIDDRLSTSGQPSEEELEAAAREGFEVVINLALHDDPRYSLANESGTVKSLGMDYVHIPVQFDRPTDADFQAFCEAMDAHRDKRVLIHCAANKRVTSFLGLYRVLRESWQKDAAFEPMHEIWDPNPTWAAFIDEMLGSSQRS